MMKKSAIMISLILIFGLAVMGCAPSTPDPERDTLVVAMGANPTILDPHGTNDQASSRVMGQIYQTLVVLTDDLEIVPGLAESWTAIDELTYEFKLRPNVKFHNGETLTASDVKFSLLRALNTPRVAFIVFPIDKDSIEVVDDLTIRFATSFPFGPLFEHLAHPAVAILNEKAVTAGGADYGQGTEVASTHPVGTGPFRFVSWDRGLQQVVIERNEDYHGTKALLRQVTFRVIPDNTVRTIALETGEVDLIYDVQPSDASRVAADPTLTLFRDDNLSLTYIGFNVQKAPFDDVRVRQAINLAIDMNQVVNTVFFGVGSVSNGPLHTLVNGANPNLEVWERDLDAARALLAEAGFPNGFSTTLWTNDNLQRVQIAEIVQNQLADVGIVVEVKEVEFAQYLNDTAAGLHDMFILGWTTVTGDADYGLFPLFHSSQMGAPGNRAFYSNARVDELLEIGRESKDPAVRQAAYFEAQEIIRDEAPWIFTWNGENLSASTASLRGFVQNPSGLHRLSTVFFAP